VTSLFDPSREIGGLDPLDSRIGRRPTVREVARLDVLLRSRAALGLAPASAPGVIFLPLGFLLGPRGFDLLSPAVLAYLSPVVTVGLAALGVFVGLGLGAPRRVPRALLAAASLEATVTLLLVAVGLYAIAHAFSLSFGGALPLVALAFGVVGATSSAGAAEVSNAPVHRLASRIADLDDVVPVLVGGLLLAWARSPSIGGALWFFVLTIVVALLVALAGALLVERATSGPEHIAFFAGLLLLLGGSAQFLSVSSMLAGMIAGVAWASGPTSSHEVIRDLLGRIQHPVVVLLLLVAGASIAPGPGTAALFTGFVGLRLAGKAFGGWAAARRPEVGGPRRLGLFLTAPGVIGVAFALNAALLVPAGPGSTLVTVAVLGSVASEVIALLLLPRLERDR
jgi:hypothetical protein